MKIFLSSTYQDLIAHRNAAREALERLGQQADRMEVFGARPQEPMTACLEEIDQCDLFVGIYAHRYGYVPAGASASITEMELTHAGKTKKPIFCFIINNDLPWPPKMIEYGVAKKMKALKETVKSYCTPDTFTTPEDLALKVATSVGRYLAEKRSDSEKHPGQRLILNNSEMADVLKIIGVDPIATYVAHNLDLRVEKMLKQGKEVRAGELRAWLLRHGAKALVQPMQVTVVGVLQPYVLMHSGWWDKERENAGTKKGSRDQKTAGEGGDSPEKTMHGLQEWLYHGLQEWAPSWGYAWQWDTPESIGTMPVNFGQIADEMCDEAESIPVFIPCVKAVEASEMFRLHPGGLQVKVTGFLAHRKHFCLALDADTSRPRCDECNKQPGCLSDTKFGGTLDFCLKVDPDFKTHAVKIVGPAAFYSGYLWKCLVPESWVTDPAKATLKDSFFIWEHTNFADAETRVFNLDSLERKQEFLEKKFGPMHLLQKSSLLVPGTPTVPSGTFYDQLLDYRKS